MAKEIFDYLYKKYYSKVLHFCALRLNRNIHDAEDCTQEVFLILQEKLSDLVDLESISPWLYRTADLVVRNYRKKYPETIDIEEIPEIPDDIPQESILDVLTEQERTLVELYFRGEDKKKLARDQGITLDALYMQISRIRKKLQEYSPNSNK